MITADELTLSKVGATPAGYYTVFDCEIFDVGGVVDVFEEDVGHYAEARLNQGIPGASVPQFQASDKVKIQIRLSSGEMNKLVSSSCNALD